MKVSLSPSSLGDLFGHGFLSATERFRVDIGEVESNFDEESRARMELGNHLEDAVLDHFEWRLGIEITDRNTETLEALNGMSRFRMDGMTVYNGVPTVVECKVSNSKSNNFYDNFGYELQVQAYMEFLDIEQALLLGLQNGEPAMRVIKRDRELGKDIVEMTEFYSMALIGLLDFKKDFPHHIVEKYAASETLDVVPEVNSDDYQEMLELAMIKEKMKELRAREREISDKIKKKFDKAIIETDDIKVTVRTQTRRGAFDYNRIRLDHPEIDFEKYRKEDTFSTVVRVDKVK